MKTLKGEYVVSACSGQSLLEETRVSGTGSGLGQQEHRAQTGDWLSMWHHIPCQNFQDHTFVVSIPECYEGVFVRVERENTFYIIVCCVALIIKTYEMLVFICILTPVHKYQGMSLAIDVWNR